MIIKTPKISQQKLFTLLAQKEAWIRKKLQKEFALKPKELQEVEFLGEIYKVEALPELHKALQRAKTIIPQTFQKKYDQFLKSKAQTYIPQRVAYFAQQMNIEYKTIRFRKMKRRWGSCSKDGVLTFNTNLMKKEKNFIDEVVVHELAHRVHFNHSKAFYKLMNKYI